MPSEQESIGKEQQRAAAVGAEASVPTDPSQQKRKQDDLMREELNEYLINTPFVSAMTEQEKIDAFYNMKLAEKRRKTNERIKRCKLNKKTEMATKRANEAAEFEQAIAAVSPIRLKTEEVAADAEFTQQYYTRNDGVFTRNIDQQQTQNYISYFSHHKPLLSIAPAE